MSRMKLNGLKKLGPAPRENEHFPEKMNTRTGIEQNLKPRYFNIQSNFKIRKQLSSSFQVSKQGS